MSVRDIWEKSPAFNHFRNFEWMEEPCRSCPEKVKDYGGCRCQAYLLTGNMNATDPVCGLSPRRDTIQQAIDAAREDALSQAPKPLVFRNSRNAKALARP